MELNVNGRFEKMETDVKEFKSEVKDRFEKMELNVNGRFEKMETNVKEFKGEVKQRFDQIAASIERLGDKLDARDARQRTFTMRMFGIAITLSFLGVFGVLIKTFGVL
jgi:uncharacterized protein YjbJ (UPF0337 family)